MSRTLSLNFARLSDPNLEALSRVVLYNMSSNSELFPLAEDMVKELQPVFERFKQAFVDAYGSGRVKAFDKNLIRQQLIGILKQLGLYVMLEAKGDEFMLLSSGFPLAKRGGQSWLGAPQNFRVLPGEKSGEIILQTKRVSSARSYTYQYTQAPLTPASVWQTEHGTTCKTVLRGLQPGVQYCFRVGAVGSKQQVQYTDVIVRYVWF